MKAPFLEQQAALNGQQGMTRAQLEAKIFNKQVLI